MQQCSSAGHWRTDGAVRCRDIKCSQTKKDSWLKLFAKIPTCFYNLAKTYWYFLIPNPMSRHTPPRCTEQLHTIQHEHLRLLLWREAQIGGKVISRFYPSSFIVPSHCSRAWQTRALEQDRSFLVSFLTECFYRYHLSIKLFSFRNIGATSRLNIFFLV